MHAKFFALLAILLLIPLVHAFDEKTLDQKFVNDHADILSSQEEAALTLFLDELEKNSSLEFAVVTIKGLDGDSVEDASLRAAEALGVGKSDVDNGLLLFIAMEEREWRIEVGYGLEGSIPDVIAGRIGRDVLVPALAEENYAEGIFNTFNALAGYALQDPSIVSKYDRKKEKNVDWIFWILIAIFIFILIISRKGRGSVIFFPPMGGRNMHGRGGGGFGGGFGGFGGGGFGGGGAGGKF